jgi:hypothetical protein
VARYERLRSPSDVRSTPMGDKSPKKSNAKKPAKTIKEKRAAKNEKRHPNAGFGSS